MNQESYLGDGVYVTFDGYQIGLRCDCMSVPNTIFLEPEMLMKLNQAYAMWAKPEAVKDAHEQVD